MTSKRFPSVWVRFACGAAALCLLAGPAWAVKEKDKEETPLGTAAFDSERLRLTDSIEALDEASAKGLVEPDLVEGWAKFKRDRGGDWEADFDKRTGRLAYIEGSGVAFVPGRGNGLTRDDIAKHLKPNQKEPDLRALESISRGFLSTVAHLFGLNPNELVLNQGRSASPASHLWFVDFDVVMDGLAVEGARVVLRINSGNLIQLGSENLAAPSARAPRAKLSREEAQEALGGYLGGFLSSDEWVEGGSLHLMPVDQDEPAAADGFQPGKGRGVVPVWQFVFRRGGEAATWQGRVDAVSGEILSFLDINNYGSATGGTYTGDRPTPEVVRPLPFANVAAGVYTNSAGIFSGTTGTTTLDGQRVKISDTCGSISKSADASGLIALGTSGGTDCTTPGTGGAGNTHASRTQFYMLNRAKQQALGWLPTNSWLSAKLTANVNINSTCNAFWNGSTVNFYRSGGGCANTGELPGVSIHEYGHGLDSNDGNGSSTDKGTGETYGDFTAALATHNSCIGAGFLGSNCGGYGDACTSCTGVRDIDWAKHASNTPHTVANFTQPKCPTSATYKGPCGREGHCESYVSSEAVWDLANRDLPSPGSGAAWSIVDRLWYLSRSTATKGFNCTASGTWSANGCFTGSYFRTMRAVDDDNGNLADGTPHGGAIGTAFNRHGIACTTDAAWNTTFAGCAAPAVPTMSLTGGNNQVTVNWSGSSGVFDVYRNEAGCNAGFVKVANDVSGTSYVDSAVANGFTYYYQVAAQPSGNEACASFPSTCQSVTPSGGGGCTPPAAPTGLTATAASQTQINLSWNAVTGATEYRILRSTTSGGPYTQVGTSTTTSFSNTGLTCNTTYYYVVRAYSGCESANSSQAQATTSACTGNVLQNGVPVSNISGATGSQQFWTMSVPAGATNLSFQTSGGTGDVDLYVRFGSAPTTSTYDCRSWSSTNNETCSFPTPQTGTYHVLLYGYATYSGVTLVGSYTAGGGGSELIVNGGFETGTTPWVLSGNAYRTATGSYPHSGVAYSYLGNVNNASGSEYQQITIPSGTSPSLSFWLNVTSSETTTTIQYDKLYVEVRNTAGTLLSTLATYSNLNKGTAGVYSQKSGFSLASWAGQTVRIQFRATTDVSLITTFRVDDVSVK